MTCQGTHELPASKSFDAIPAAIAHWDQISAAHQRRFDQHRAKRENAPLGSFFWTNWAYAHKQRARLFARLNTLRKAAGQEPFPIGFKFLEKTRTSPGKATRAKRPHALADPTLEPRY